MPITIEDTVEASSLICQKCKVETGLTRDFLLVNDIVNDFHCPSCNELIFSCKPEIRTYSYNYASSAASSAGYHGYSEYD